MKIQLLSYYNSTESRKKNPSFEKLFFDKEVPYHISRFLANNEQIIALTRKFNDIDKDLKISYSGSRAFNPTVSLYFCPEREGKLIADDIAVTLNLNTSYCSSDNRPHHLLDEDAIEKFMGPDFAAYIFEKYLSELEISKSYKRIKTHFEERKILKDEIKNLERLKQNLTTQKNIENLHFKIERIKHEISERRAQTGPFLYNGVYYFDLPKELLSEKIKKPSLLKRFLSVFSKPSKPAEPWYHDRFKSKDRTSFWKRFF